MLDISFDENRADVLRLLDAGATVRYFDHHHAGVLPSHPNLAALIEESPSVCTSSLVDRVLEHRYQTWAVVAAFGDNLRDLGFALAQSAVVKAGDVAMLERLGVLLNYNAYGNATSDLLFHPAELAERMLPFQDPMEFVRRSPAYEELGARYDDDMQRAVALRPRVQVPGALFTELPDEPWARRAIGVLANTLAQRHPGSAIAIAVPNGKDGYTVSVRVPSAGRMPADEFCRSFPGGNGRKTAAGINHLPAQDLHRFAAHFEARFGAPG